MKALQIAFSILIIPLILAGGDARDFVLTGHSPSLLIDRTGKAALLFVDSSGRLSLGRESARAGDLVVTTGVQDGRIPAFPRLEEDRNGGLWALWIEDDGRSSALRFGRVPPDGIPAGDAVFASDGTIFSPDVDFDRSNTAWIAWIHRRSGSFEICARETGLGRTWTVGAPSLASASQVRILADGPGNTWLFWIGRDLGRDEVFYSRFDGTCWTRAGKLNTRNDVPHLFLSAAADSAGRPGICWSAYDGDDYEIYASFWDGSSWSEEEPITRNRISDAFPSLAFARGDVPVVVWSRTSGSTNSICARYREAGGWVAEAELYASSKAEAVAPGVAVRDGRLIVCWQSGKAIRSRNLAFEELGGGGSGTPAPSGKTAPEAEPGENRTIAFGDSITRGETDGPSAFENGYSGLLQAILEAEYGSAEVVNEGVPGEITVNGLGRMSDVLAKDLARYLLLMEGTNDVIFIEISTDTTAFNIEEMVKKCRGAGTLPVLSTILPRGDWRWDVPFYQDRIDAINDSIRSIVEGSKLPFADMFNIFFNYPESEGGWRSLIPDGTHPGERGYEIMAQAWWNEIKDIPFPPISLAVQRSTERSLLLNRRVNYITWQHSPKIRNPFQFRTYQIFRKDAAEPDAAYQLIALVPYSPFHTPQKFSDLNVQESHHYRYAISLLGIDLVEGPPSDKVSDSD
ncbi:MAG: SGNH/GDSL hydrolase family protein [Candidatus Aminicenantales bacterium]